MKKNNTAVVLTIPNAENYGSVLQAYALEKFLLKQKFDVSIANYNPDYLKGRYSLIKLNYTNPVLWMRSIVSNFLNLPFAIKKKFRFHKFRNRYMKITPKKITEIDNLQNYDYVFVGGDQLWNTRITQYNTFFFLHNGDKLKNKIAFSVSLGYSDRRDEETAFYKQYIINFDRIYVREDYDTGYVKDIIGFKGETDYVLDPTLLIDGMVWEKFPLKNIIKEKYILIYMFNDDLQVVDIAQKVGRKLKLPIYQIESSWRKQNRNGFINVKGVGPVEFVSLFKNAEYIVTNSFHGTVFSVIFKKNFNCVPYQGTEGRMISLLKLLELETALNNTYVELNYNNAIKVLDCERKKAQKIICRIMEDEI